MEDDKLYATQNTTITLRCTKSFKQAANKIAESEARSLASYIKGLVLADMKNRESR